MGKAAAERLAGALLQDGVAPTLPAAIVENGGRADQRLEVTTVAELGRTVADFNAEGPVLLIVGEVVAKRVVTSPINASTDVYFAHG